jgi:hypothetical protein
MTPRAKRWFVWFQAAKKEERQSLQGHEYRRCGQQEQLEGMALFGAGHHCWWSFSWSTRLINTIFISFLDNYDYTTGSFSGLTLKLRHDFGPHDL